MLRNFFWSMAVLGGLALGQGRAEAGYVLTANAAGSQASTVPGVSTETFNAFNAGVYTTLTTAVGKVTSDGEAIVVADQYGGAGGVGNYFSIGAQSGHTSATLALNAAATYFGFWWSAADAQNSIAFFSNGVQVASYTRATAFAGLGPDYNGNPNSNPKTNTGEPYAYFNFTATGVSTFDRVVFSNNGTGTGFESDNWSVASVPEPSSLALTGMGLVALVGVARRRRAAR